MKQYIVDAFTEKVFSGNPAAVCVMDAWPEDELLMKITMENNLSETAFAVWEGDAYHLRWFTPGGEIDLCGHATLATGYIILRFYHPDWKQVSFDTLSGRLTVTRAGDLYEMDFPAYALHSVPVTDEMEAAIGVRPLEAWMGRDLLCILPDAGAIPNLQPDMQKVKALPGLLLHITAAGTDFDSVSRTFAPKSAIDEDPVCGSGHCHIMPFWGARLGKRELCCYQASRRGGVLYGRLLGERLKLSGKAALFAEAVIYPEH
ncbi:MAG: PhzF family phenazine biosynthesis protein [Ruminococcaceae bacterium]|nr:PhzF family phenazine biosynthesis protein [Oscillospiraceae bacterium]